jgi:hypothetical protein
MKDPGISPIPLSRRAFLQSTTAAGLFLKASALSAQDRHAPFPFRPERDLIPAPSDPSQWPDFRRQLAAWRDHRRRELNYSDTLYRRPEFGWVTANFACCFVMMYDELFYDHQAGHYTIARFLEHGRREFGGYDSVVLWHAYPRIGLDPRNQFDFYRDMPGGLPGVRAVVHELQAAGVRAFINYNPWDTGTRRESKPDLEMLCEFVRELDVDGIFLDTLSQGAPEFRALLDQARPGVALESELALPLEHVHNHHCSWAQWFADSTVPGVLRNKWFERRHLQHQIKRWDHDHSGELHSAWMNGSGIMIWENVFGSWIGWNARDRSLLRSILPIQRQFPQLWHEGRWTPLVPTLQPEVYASLWEQDDLRLWTLVNRSDRFIHGAVLDPKLEPSDRCFDLVAGREIQTGTPLAAELAARGIGSLVAVGPDRIDARFREFLDHQRAIATRFDPNTAFPGRNTRLYPVTRTRPAIADSPDMIRIPGATLELVSEMRVRECGFYESNPPDPNPLVSSYEIRYLPLPRRVTVPGFALDLTPVTNAEFARFLNATQYRPRHPENFLRHWTSPDPADLPRHQAEHPVVYVDLEDARAYARWAGKRLPTEEEWQYAAAGPDALRYPWGNELLPDRCNDGDGTAPVRSYPAGRSPFGIFDLCGNVWEWTESERTDDRTRFCILKGGSYYAARGSNWYLDGGPQPNPFATKCLLLWPGLDRCATVGFRCARD